MDLLVKAAAKALAFCFLAFLGILCITTGLSACTEAEFTWPTLTVTWNIDEKDGYLADSAVGPAIHQACSPEITIAGCCWNVDITNKKLFLDGVEDNGQVLNEGTHNAKLEFDASIYGTNPDATFHKVVTYTFPKPFTIDKTAPIINLTKPKNNASIPITDVSLTGSVSDADARLGIVDVSLSVSSPCRFLKDFSGATVNLGTISGKYCDADYYAAVPALCIADIGNSKASFALNYDLRDYVDFPEGQDCAFYFHVGAVDRVGNGSAGSDSTVFNSTSIYFAVDQAPPVVTINEPAAAGADMYWGNSGAPVISGLAKDLSDITSVWLTIKDERANNWWNGTKWQAKIAIVSAEKAGTTTVTWRYYGITRESVQSGIFTITAYARDKFDHVGHAAVTGKNKKRIDLNNKDFTSLSMSVQDVSNIGANAENPHSFTSNSSENTISVSAKITPARLAGELNNFVQWDVVGENSDSGNPNKPYNGNPSLFLVEPPTMPTKPAGRTSPMAYTVYTGVKYDFEGESIEYYSPNYGNITQDNLDALRQEYLDLSTGYNLPRGSFDRDLPVFSGLLGSTGAETAKHSWHILKFINIKAMTLDNALGPLGLALKPSSGYRCPIGNRVVGGVCNSNHMLGRAFDYAQDDAYDNCKVWETAKSVGVTENYLYVGKKVYYAPECPPPAGIRYDHGHVAW